MGLVKPSFISCILFLLMLAPVTAHAVEKILVMTYHQDPPFISSEKEATGLSFDLVDYLNQQSPQYFQFELRSLPRTRLNEYIKRDYTAIVPWVSNIWFQDPDETKYLWTKGFVKDGDVVIVPTSSELNYKQPLSLIGKRVIAVRGFRFSGIDELVSSGDIERLDANSILQCLKMLASGRGDAVLAPRSAALFTLKQTGLQSQLRLEPVYHSEYSRKFMVLQKRNDIRDFLNEVIRKMSTDPLWQRILDQYE